MVGFFFVKRWSVTSGAELVLTPAGAWEEKAGEGGSRWEGCLCFLRFSSLPFHAGGDRRQLGLALCEAAEPAAG